MLSICLYYSILFSIINILFILHNNNNKNIFLCFKVSNLATSKHCTHNSLFVSLGINNVKERRYRRVQWSNNAVVFMMRAVKGQFIPRRYSCVVPSNHQLYHWMERNPPTLISAFLNRIISIISKRLHSPICSFLPAKQSTIDNSHVFCFLFFVNRDPLLSFTV